MRCPRLTVAGAPTVRSLGLQADTYDVQRKLRWLVHLIMSANFNASLDAMSHKHSVRVLPKAKSSARSKIHTQFNNLIKKLEAERKRLAEWHDVLPRFNARLDAELGPLDHLYFVRMKELVFVFHGAWENMKLTKAEYAKLSDLICEMVDDLMDADMGESLEPIYAKHCGSDLFGDVDDDDEVEDPALEQLREEFEEFMEALGLGAEPESDAAAPQQKPASKVGAKEARRIADEAKLQHSVRDVFRKLASSLHPDRETDPVERERKNALMQRANVAYAANDLLSLLELQFEIAQIDAEGMETLGEDRIKQYIKTLKRQLEEAQVESDVLQEIMLGKLGMVAIRKISPDLLEDILEDKIGKLQDDLESIERDLSDFKDKKLLKAFLKNIRFDDGAIGFYE